MNKGTLLVGVIDISDRVRAQAAVLSLQAEFAHAARVSMLGELTASIAHEVNQPLAAIAASGEAGLRWLNREQPNLDEVRTLTTRVVADARRAADVISRVRSMAGHRTPTSMREAINSLIEEAMLFVQHEAEARDARITLDLAPHLPAVIVDRTQIQQVLINLIINAIQAMVDAGDATRDVIVTSSLKTDGMVEVTVEDSGPGVALYHLDRLFESFFTTKSSGMGMGLPICRSIVEAHGGRIAAADATGGGALFSFTLPGAEGSKPQSDAGSTFQENGHE